MTILFTMTTMIRKIMTRKITKLFFGLLLILGLGLTFSITQYSYAGNFTQDDYEDQKNGGDTGDPETGTKDRYDQQQDNNGGGEKGTEGRYNQQQDNNGGGEKGTEGRYNQQQDNNGGGEKGTEGRYNQQQDNNGGDSSPSTGNQQTNTNTTPSPSNNEAGINIDCLKGSGGKCGVNVYKMMGIRKKSGQNPNVETFVQDIVLSLTMFFGTIFTIAVFFSGFLYIFSAIKGADSLQAKAKKGIIGGVVGFLLVTGAFAIVRLVQFLAQGVG